MGRSWTSRGVTIHGHLSEVRAHLPAFARLTLLSSNWHRGRPLKIGATIEKSDEEFGVRFDLPAKLETNGGPILQGPMQSPYLYQSLVCTRASGAAGAIASSIQSETPKRAMARVETHRTVVLAGDESLAVRGKSYGVNW